MSRPMPRPNVVPTVDLIVDAECPNVDDARALLRTALDEAGLPAEWREWDREASETPPALRGLGSPTILVNGVDVSGVDETKPEAERANCCRVYAHDSGLRGVPALRTVVLALTRRAHPFVLRSLICKGYEMR